MVDRLMAIKDAQVTVYDNMSMGEMKLIEHHMKDKRFKFIEEDLLDKKALEKAIKGHDFVHHIAANSDVRKGHGQPLLDLEQGPVATSNLLEAMRKNGIKKISFCSSSVVYGVPSVYPTPEEYGPTMPVSLYGAGKLGCEGLISAYTNTYGFQAWIFRFANIIGPRETHGILVDFINKLKKNPKRLEILGDGKQRKSYLTVEDCVDAMLHVIEHAKDPVNVYNLGSKDQIEVSRIAELLVRELGLKDVKFDYTGGEVGWIGDVKTMFLATEKLDKSGWRARMGSEEAVLYTIRALKKELWD